MFVCLFELKDTDYEASPDYTNFVKKDKTKYKYILQTPKARAVAKRDKDQLPKNIWGLLWLEAGW